MICWIWWFVLVIGHQTWNPCCAQLMGILGQTSGCSKIALPPVPISQPYWHDLVSLPPYCHYDLTHYWMLRRSLPHVPISQPLTPSNQSAVLLINISLSSFWRNKLSNFGEYMVDLNAYNSIGNSWSNPCHITLSSSVINKSGHHPWWCHPCPFQITSYYYLFRFLDSRFFRNPCHIISS